MLLLLSHRATRRSSPTVTICHRVAHALSRENPWVSKLSTSTVTLVVTGTNASAFSTLLEGGRARAGSFVVHKKVYLYFPFFMFHFYYF
jgi:hypothetical protein